MLDCTISATQDSAYNMTQIVILMVRTSRLLSAQRDELQTSLSADIASKSKLEEMLRYVLRQWLNKSTIGPARLSVRDNADRTNNVIESFHASLWRRVKVAHPNLFSFLGHLQRTTIDCKIERSRLDRGTRIRRTKRKDNLTNDARIKTCRRR